MTTALFLFFSTVTMAESLENNVTQAGEIYFSEHNYEKALPLLQEEADNGLKSAMYQLAYMYQNGLGVKQNYKKAAQLYQQAAADYEYVLNKPSPKLQEKLSFSERLSKQIDPATNKDGDAFAFSKLDTKTSETKHLLSKFLNDGFFGLKPYNTNYLIPVSYASDRYRRISSNTHYNNYTPEQLKEYAQYQEKTEVEFQFSLRKPLTFNLFGFNESINAAYTQKVWWQLYSDSAPFRETNYLPEIFVVVPTSKSFDERSGLKALKFGFLHESNGQEGYRSRSWNRLYLSGMWQWNNLFMATRLWYRLSEDEKYEGYYEGKVNPDTGEYEPNDDGDDNPDIQDYLGFGDIKISYLLGQHQFAALLRYNFGAGGEQRGAIDFNWSYPFLNSENTFWYVKFFTGYGESLIDYDQYVNKASFGFSFSRALF
jgi:phospholipase A1